MFPRQIAKLLLCCLAAGSLLGCSLPGDADPGSTPAPTAAPPTPTADVSADFVAYLNPAMGIALRHPPGWVIREEPVLQLASDSDLFENTTGVTTGARLSLAPAPGNLGAADDLGAALFALVTSQGALQVVDGPDLADFSGQEAATLAVLSRDAEGLEFYVYYTVVRTDSAAVLIIGATPDPATFEPLIQAVGRSVIISAPQLAALPPTLTPPPVLSPIPGADATPEAEAEEEAPEGEAIAAIEVLQVPIPADFVQYRSADGRYSLGYPPDWVFNDENPEAVLFASNEALLEDNPYVEGGGTIWFYPYTTQATASLDPVVLLSTFITNYPIYDGFNIISEPAPLLINGQPGATSRYEASFEGASLIVDYYVVINGSHMVFVVSLLAAADAAQLQPLSQAIVATLTLQP